uniref:Speriolin C-terminal domain-containing protein n=1 Tax=Apteryx owenii TaxID=8824 RepID=A0A8B9SEW9_APTOW
MSRAGVHRCSPLQPARDVLPHPGGARSLPPAAPALIPRACPCSLCRPLPRQPRPGEPPAAALLPPGQVQPRRPARGRPAAPRAAAARAAPRPAGLRHPLPLPHVLGAAGPGAATPGAAIPAPAVPRADVVNPAVPHPAAAGPGAAGAVAATGAEVAGAVDAGPALARRPAQGASAEDKAGGEGTCPRHRVCGQDGGRRGPGQRRGRRLRAPRRSGERGRGRPASGSASSPPGWGQPHMAPRLALADAKQQTRERIVGEIAFQLDRRILASVFPERVRLYGFTVSNIPEKIMTSVFDNSQAGFDERYCAAATRRYVTLMNRLKALGYSPDVHPSFTESVVNAYGILRERPEPTGPDARSYGSPGFLRRVVLETVPAATQPDVLLLLECLQELARDDGKPLFVW